MSDINEREIAPVHLISYLTQKLIFVAIYEKWVEVTVTEAAIKLKVSKMSISRCFDEIEYLNVDIMGMKGKSRAITVPTDIKKLWEDMKPILRNPVIARYELQEDIHLENKAGISALCEYSLLSDNRYPTYAITKKEMAGVGLKNMRQVHKGEEIGCLVLELGYFIDFMDKKTEDPMSVALSLTEAEKQDERVDISVDEMLEEYVWLSMRLNFCCFWRWRRWGFLRCPKRPGGPGCCWPAISSISAGTRPMSRCWLLLPP